jgi:uncharacterized protein
MKPFEPHPLLCNPHAQTISYAFWPRRFPRLSQGTYREFEVEPGTRIRGECHWQPVPQQCPTVVLVHGLEGSSQSGSMRGIAERAFAAGWNAIRLNQRNCGGTESLTPTLYNSGLSGDYRAVLLELIERDALPEIFFAGYSMGGNLVLKMTGELGPEAPRQLRGVAAVCPCIDLALCADAICLPQNFVYQGHFVRELKRRIRRKAKLFPGKFDLNRLAGVRTVRDFDQAITAAYCGFEGAADYYARSSALRVLGAIRVPTLILTAQDDPVVPFTSFSDPALVNNPNITLIAPSRGGHCAFIEKNGNPERFWGEAKLFEYFRQVSNGAVDTTDFEEQAQKNENLGRTV